MDENPNYYAIIPANIRYDKSLRPMEKLIYGEISALANKQGYCHATNKYFSELYDVTNTSVSRWINHLAKCNYLKVLVIRNDTGQVIQRRIYLSDNPINNFEGSMHKIVNTSPQKSLNPPHKNVKENITSNNNTSNNKKNNVGLAPDDVPYQEIINFLNNQLGTKYHASSSKTRSLIKARWNDGFRLDDFKQVILNKAAEWQNNSDMAKYLRPETLFGTKFEAYLNQKRVEKNKSKPKRQYEDGLGW